MDRFEVTAKSADILEPSTLVAEMQDDAPNGEEFPVVWDGYAYRFDGVNGGYVQTNGYHLVKLSSHGVQQGNMNNLDSGQYEVHLSDNVWNLEVSEFHEFQDGPVYTLALMVTGYEEYPYSFMEAMRANIDGRWSEHDYE